jgi:ADP-glucose pyrophosphorylase
MAVVPVRRSQASRLGIVRVDESNRLVELVEKPQSPQQRKDVYCDRLRENLAVQVRARSRVVINPAPK